MEKSLAVWTEVPENAYTADSHSVLTPLWVPEATDFSKTNEVLWIIYK